MAATNCSSPAMSTVSTDHSLANNNNTNPTGDQLFGEIRDQNRALERQVFAQKCLIQVLDNYRKYAAQLRTQCRCRHAVPVFAYLDELDNKYHRLMAEIGPDTGHQSTHQSTLSTTAAAAVSGVKRGGGGGGGGKPGKRGRGRPASYTMRVATGQSRLDSNKFDTKANNAMTGMMSGMDGDHRMDGGGGIVGSSLDNLNNCLDAKFTGAFISDLMRQSVHYGDGNVITTVANNVAAAAAAVNSVVSNNNNNNNNNNNSSTDQQLIMAAATAGGNYKCSVCGQLFPTSADMDIHMICAHHYVFCGYCQQFFSAKQDLDAHLEAKHSIELVVGQNQMIFRCHECGHSFPTVVHLQYHLASGHHHHIPPHQQHPNLTAAAANLAAASVNPNNIIANHFNDSQSMNRFTDCRPQPAFPTQPPPPHYGQRLVNGQHECRTCSKRFANDDQLARHVRNGHQLWQCSKCPQVFDDIHTMTSHQRTHHRQHQSSTSTGGGGSDGHHQQHRSSAGSGKQSQGYLCSFSDCRQQFNQLHEYHQHLNDVHLKYQCPLCSKRYATSEQLTKHENSVHQVNQQIDSYRCQWCTNAKYKTQQGLKLHMKAHHKDILLATSAAGNGNYG